MYIAGQVLRGPAGPASLRDELHACRHPQGVRAYVRVRARAFILSPSLSHMRVRALLPSSPPPPPPFPLPLPSQSQSLLPSEI